MPKTLLLTFVLPLMSLSAAADDSTLDLSAIDRTIASEPAYESQPHYALFVFGPHGARRSWLVIDGDRVAYIDRNGDGDLTDPEDRVEFDAEASEKLTFGNASTFLGMHRFPLGEIHGTPLDFDLWVRNPDFEPTEDNPYPAHLRKWDENNWVNGSLMRSAADGSRSQNPLLLTADPETAQVSRFGGPVSIGLKWGDNQRLEQWPKRFVFDVHLGHQNLPAQDCTEDGFRMTRFTTAEVPAVIEPVARFEFPAATESGTPITRDVRLNRRCCGDTFYAEMVLPQNVVADTATVRVEVMDWTGSGSKTAEFQVPIREGISQHSEAVYVMFEQDDLGINDALGALRKRGLDVFIQPEGLLVHREGRPAYSVRYRHGDDVPAVASSIGKGTEHALQLDRCDARFEIGIIDAETSLQEPDLLNELQSALQQRTGGFVYHTWDRQLIPPQ